MKKLILSAFLFVALGAQAQTKTQTTQVFDQTNLVETKTSIKIVTSNEAVFQQFTKYMASAIKGYSVKMKHDRLGDYKEYTIPCKLDLKPEVLEFVGELDRVLNRKK